MATRSARRATPAAPKLPRLWSGVRRRYLLLLVLVGIGQAAAAGAGAHVLTRIIGTANSSGRVLLVVVLVLAAVTVGVLHALERVVAERLSQNYVHEIRLGLLRNNLAGRISTLGVAVTRTSNDLASVKNWVSMGIVPLTVGIPLILGATLVLAMLQPVLALGLILPMAVLVILFAVLTPRAYVKSRRLRRARGRLSGHIADAILGVEAARSGGGVVRELNRLDRFGKDLATAAIDRAKFVGALRGVAAGTTGLATATIVAAGLFATIPASTIAAALSVVGLLGNPIHALGQAAEYRQTYRAARRIIGPAAAPEPAVATENIDAVGGSTDTLRVANLRLPDGTTMPTLEAMPGDRVVLAVDDDHAARSVLRRFAGLEPVGGGEICIHGTDVSTASHGRLRRLVGYAAQGMLLGRASIARTVLYRSADAHVAEADPLIDRVGLRSRVADLPKGARTELRHGGEPLTVKERARLLLARAIFNDPAVLVLDHLDADLGSDGRMIMHEILRTYAGIVLIASDDPYLVVAPTHIWGRDGVRRLGAGVSADQVARS
jgi:ABC-type multidrug transport system fused ATPase/permease subunit